LHKPTEEEAILSAQHAITTSKAFFVVAITQDGYIAAVTSATTYSDAFAMNA